MFNIIVGSMLVLEFVIVRMPRWLGFIILALGLLNLAVGIF